MLGSIKKVWGAVTGSAKLTDDIFDKDNGHLSKLGSWMGNQQFTSQEKSIANAASIKAVMDFSVATLSENTDRSKSRRNIAEYFVKWYTMMAFLAFIVWPIDAKWAEHALLIISGFGLAGFFASIGVFHFGSHALAKHNESKNKGR